MHKLRSPLMRCVNFLRRIIGINQVFQMLAALEWNINQSNSARIPTIVNSSNILTEIDLFTQRSRANEYIELLKPRKLLNAHLARIGSKYDGGYIFVDDLSQNDLFVSAGIAEDFNVDLQVVNQVGKLIMIDPSIEPVDFPNKNQTFIQKPLGPKTDSQAISLDELLSNENYSDVVLKIDIEGAEWEIFSTLGDSLFNRFRQIIVEVHWLSDIGSKAFHDKKILALQKLLMNHELVYIHANNWGDYRILGGLPIPDVLELTYLRKDSYDFAEGTSEELSLLSSPCNPDKPDYVVWWV